MTTLHVLSSCRVGICSAMQVLNRRNIFFIQVHPTAVSSSILLGCCHPAALFSYGPRLQLRQMIPCYTCGMCSFLATAAATHHPYASCHSTCTTPAAKYSTTRHSSFAMLLCCCLSGFHVCCTPGCRSLHLRPICHGSSTQGLCDFVLFTKVHCSNQAAAPKGSLEHGQFQRFCTW